MRIDFADVDPMFEGRTTQMGHVDNLDRSQARSGAPPPRMNMGMGRGAPTPPMQLPPNLPAGQPLPPGIGATDSISQTLAAMPPNQLLDIMSQMKSLVTSSPEQAKVLLTGHPQLAYALFQAMLMMNVVDATILQRILTTSGALGGNDVNVAPQAPPQLPPSHTQQPMYTNTPPMANRPPMQQQHYSGPPPLPPPMQQHLPPLPVPAPHSNVSHLPQEQRALLEQVLQLTPAQIAALPPDQQEGIRQLKASLGQA